MYVAYVYEVIVHHLVLRLLLCSRTNTQAPRKFQDVHAMCCFENHGGLIKAEQFVAVFTHIRQRERSSKEMKGTI